MSSNVVASPVWLCVALALALAAPEIAASAVGPPPPPCSCGGSECHRCCGDVYVPYPFGFDTGPDDTSMAPGFHLSCNDTGNGVFKLYTGNVEVVNISLPQGQMLVLNHISYSCYDATGNKVAYNNWNFKLAEEYSFSGSKNKFTAIGCRTLAYISGDTTGGGSVEDGYLTGCMALCGRAGAGNLSHLSNGSCSGMGCCQTSIPPDLRYYEVSFDDHIKPSGFDATNCSYAVLMEWSSFVFQTTYLTTNEFNKSYNGRVPVLLDWVVGNETCGVASTKPGYACVSSNSVCVDAASGLGYFCNCTKGYQGNPYLKDPGCTDIDECSDNRTYPCLGNCENKIGTYDCFCPPGTQGNASIQECKKLPSPFGLGERLAIGIPGGILVAVIAFLAVVLLHHKRRLRKQAHFHHNGGQLLKRMLLVDGNNSFTIYDSGDIMQATRNFHKTTIVGEGAHGTVYKATLRVGGGATVTVAVKRCKVIDESRKKEFVQELVILCHISHPNIVRLLGCCLECEAPMLVYEFVPNRSVNHLLHGKPVRPVTLATRLRIAAETAEALAHLHSSTHPVLHGDVKPENILLADGLTAKVSDFGCSTINDNVQVVPKGTLAYLDPEFLVDFQLTKKTDVYSFGVVLVELLTRKKPQSKDGKSLTLMFQESISEGTLYELLDTEIVDESSKVVLQQAAELVSRCLAVPSTTRPSMEEVAKVLRRLQDQVPERSQSPHELELYDIGPTEIEMTTGYPTAQSQSDAASGTYTPSPRKNS